MASVKRGKYYYGDSQADLRAEIERYSQASYPARQFADAVCRCGETIFWLRLDDRHGAALRKCVSCYFEHPVGDSAAYIKDAKLEECTCPCGKDEFEITAGVALYEDSEDVRWIYLGCRCSTCGLIAVYGDWKNEYEDYRELLAQI